MEEVRSSDLIGLNNSKQNNTVYNVDRDTRCSLILHELGGCPFSPETPWKREVEVCSKAIRTKTPRMFWGFASPCTFTRNRSEWRQYRPGGCICRFVIEELD